MEKIEIVSEKEWSNTMVVARSQKLTWWPCRWLRARMMGGAVANSTPDKTKWGFQTSKPTHTLAYMLGCLPVSLLLTQSFASMHHECAWNGISRHFCPMHVSMLDERTLKGILQVNLMNRDLWVKGLLMMATWLVTQLQVGWTI
jgi:hypothetical protein